MQVSDDDTVLPPSSVDDLTQPATETTTSSSQKSTDDGWLHKSQKRSPKQPQQDPPLLPLDWTRVKRRRTNDSTGDDDEDCCPLVVPTLDEHSLKPDQELVQGLGVICLHDSDPSWFQGYFFPILRPNNDHADLDDDSDSDADWFQKHQQQNNTNNNNKPWGLLATQEDLDDCLRCVDGGYRRLALTVIPYPHKQRKETLVNIEWTGGDMMRLMGERANLEPEQLRTGKRAVPLVETLFGSLVRKCRQNLSPEESSEVLDLLPDVVVISGPMKLVMTKKKDEELDSDN